MKYWSSASSLATSAASPWPRRPARPHCWRRLETGPGRAVLADDRRADAEQALDQLAGVGDRRRGEQELRLGAVDRSEPPQPAQYVRDVRAEDTAVDMRLVHDHVAEVREHVAPAVV